MAMLTWMCSRISSLTVVNACGAIEGVAGTMSMLLLGPCVDCWAASGSESKRMLSTSALSKSFAQSNPAMQSE